MSRATPQPLVTVNGLRIHYLDFGGGGPPAVLHHATGFHAWVGPPIAAALASRYRVFRSRRADTETVKSRHRYQW